MQTLKQYRMKNIFQIYKHWFRMIFLVSMKDFSFFKELFRPTMKYVFLVGNEQYNIRLQNYITDVSKRFERRYGKPLCIIFYEEGEE